MKTLKPLFALLFLAGCVSTPQESLQYKPINVSGQQVVWHFETPDGIVEAAWQRNVPNARRVRALFVRQDGVCHIYTRAPSSPDDREWMCSAYHELSHCALGRWHEDRPENGCGPTDDGVPSAPKGAIAQASRG